MNHRTEPIQPSGSKPSSATQVSGPGAPDAEASEDGQVGSEQQTCLAPARGKKRRREGRKYVWLCDSSSGSFQIGCCRCPARVVILLVSTVILSLVILIIILVTILLMSPAKEDQQQRSAVDVPAPCGPACPSGWIGYEGKCYFFSEGGRNWTSGKSFCASYNSSLAVIENEPEKVIIVCSDRQHLSREVFHITYFLTIKLEMLGIESETFCMPSGCSATESLSALPLPRFQIYWWHSLCVTSALLITGLASGRTSTTIGNGQMGVN